MSLLVLLAGCRSESESNASERAADGKPPAQAPAGEIEHQPAAGGPATQVAADLPVDAAGCLAADCHQDLLRVAYRHKPIEAGACDVCHEAEQPEHRFPLKRAGREVCTFCHPVAGRKRYLHEAIAKEGCLPCHDPHGSETRFLLTGVSVELTCRRCHGIERKSHMHGPFAAGQCTVCHQPHESDNRFLLLGGTGKDHCLMCHRGKGRQLLTATTIHEPITEGECVGCHEPHSSDYPYELNAPLEELCFRCHADVEGEVAEAKSPHGAVFTGHRCANCHDPHAERRPFLLRDDLRTLCLRCHDKPQEAYDGRTIPDMRPALLNRKSLHGPVRAGQCSACHEVHGARNAELLRKYFPTQFYEAFDLVNYALCFECHSKGIVLEQETTTLTNFRDGELNLHYVHVHRAERGRTCRTCHEIHGSNLPKDIASEVPFEGGGWSMPIKFEQTATGGRCSPGCHEPKAYNRGPARRIPVRTGQPTGEKR